MASQIPPYSETNAEDFERGRKGILRKITKVFNVTPEAAEPSEENWGLLKQEVEKFLHETHWTNAVTDCEGFCELTLSDGEKKSLHDAAGDLMLDFARGFHLNHAMMRRADRSSPGGEAAGGLYHQHERLFEIYSSHVTKMALSRIHAFGFSDRSTLSLVGKLIRGAVNICDDEPFGYMAIVRPEPGNYVTKEETAITRIQKIYEHNDWVKNILVGQHRSQSKTPSGR